MYQNGFYPFQGYGTGPQIMRMTPSMMGAGTKASLGGLGNLITGIKPKFSLGSFLTGTQKTLGVINQAIPIVNQIRPIWANAKTMFKVMGALKDEPVAAPNQISNSNNNNNNSTTNPQYNYSNNINKQNVNNYTTSNSPQFFL